MSSAKTPMMQLDVDVEVGLRVRALEAELLEGALVQLGPEVRPLLNALEHFLELDDEARAPEAGRHLAEDLRVDVRLRERL